MKNKMAEMDNKNFETQFYGTMIFTTSLTKLRVTLRIHTYIRIYIYIYIRMYVYMYEGFQ
jgi:hypothetical protein